MSASAFGRHARSGRAHGCTSSSWRTARCRATTSSTTPASPKLSASRLRRRGSARESVNSWRLPARLLGLVQQDARRVEMCEFVVTKAEPVGDGLTVVLAPERRWASHTCRGIREPVGRLGDTPAAAYPVVNIDDNYKTHVDVILAVY